MGAGRSCRTWLTVRFMFLYEDSRARLRMSVFSTMSKSQSVEVVPSAEIDVETTGREDMPWVLKRGSMSGSGVDGETVTRGDGVPRLRASMGVDGKGCGYCGEVWC